MEMNLCERFPALTPFSVRREKATEVFLLLRRLDGHNGRQGKKKKQGKTVIRKPAGDDWF